MEKIENGPRVKFSTVSCTFRPFAAEGVIVGLDGSGRFHIKFDGGGYYARMPDQFEFLPPAAPPLSRVAELEKENVELRQALAYEVNAHNKRCAELKEQSDTIRGHAAEIHSLATRVERAEREAARTRERNTALYDALSNLTLACPRGMSYLNERVRQNMDAALVAANKALGNDPVKIDFDDKTWDNVRVSQERLRRAVSSDMQRLSVEVDVGGRKIKGQSRFGVGDSIKCVASGFGQAVGRVEGIHGQYRGQHGTKFFYDLVFFGDVRRHNVSEEVLSPA